MFNRALNSVLPLDVTIADEALFEARWSGAKLDAVLLTRTHLAGQTASCARPSPLRIARNGDSYFDLLHLRRGRVHVKQGGTTFEARAQEFFLVTSQSPFKLDVKQGAFEADGARIPTWLLETRLRRPERFCGRAFAANDGLGNVAVSFLSTLLSTCDHINASATAPLAAQLADLFALALSAEDRAVACSESSVRFALYERICRFIEQHLSSSALTPAYIAAKNGISERYLYRIFQESGCSVCGYIRRQRLAACRRALEDPRQLRRSIAQIGYANGFRDASHLTKAFKREFGVLPRVSRKKTNSA